MQPGKTNRTSSRTRRIIAAATVMAVSTAAPIVPVLPGSKVFTASAQFVRTTGSVSGRVTGPDGRGVAGVVVQAGEKTGATDSNGYYSIAGVPTGDTTIQVTGGVPGGYSVSGAQTKNMTTAGVSGVNFTTTRETGSVSGRVTGPDGRGVAGVIMQAGGKTGVTDGNGYYSIAGVPTGNTTIRVTGGVPDGYSVSGAQTKDVTTAGVSGVNFTTTRDTASVSGRVTGPDGRGVAGVTVRAGAETARTNANGDYTITGVPTGETTIQVVGGVPDGYSVSGAQSKNVTADGVSGVNFTTTRLVGTVSGRVTDPDGRGVAGVVVQAGDRTARTNANGEYTIAGVPTGETTIQVTGGVPGGYSVSGEQSKNVTTDGVSGVNFTTARLTGVVSGRVTDPDGRGVAGVTVQAGDRTARTNANGEYTIAGVPTGDTTVKVTGGVPGGYSVYVAQSINVTTAGVYGVNFSTSYNLVSGMVLVVNNASTPQPVAGATVTLRDGTANGRTSTTDDNGRVTFTNLLPGYYPVEVAGATGYSGTSGTLILEVGSDGETTLQVGALNQVTGSVNDDLGRAVRGASVTVSGPNNVSKKLSTDADGRFDAGRLPAGTYTVNVAGAGTFGGAQQQVSVVAGQPTDPAALTVNLVRGSIAANVTGPVDAARVVAVGGPENTTVELRMVNGRYEATNLYPGTYTLTAKAPNNYSVTNPATVQVTVEPSKTATASFGITANNGTVSGSVVGEDGKPVAGVKVELWDSKVTAKIRDLKLDGSGNIVGATDIRPGFYTVVVIPPGGYENPADTTIFVTPGGRATVNTIEVVKTTPAIDVLGVVWIDKNGNGQQDVDEGVSGLEVALQRTEDAPIIPLRSDQNGNVLFEAMPEGEYFFKVKNPGGLKLTEPREGAANEFDTKTLESQVFAIDGSDTHVVRSIRLVSQDLFTWDRIETRPGDIFIAPPKIAPNAPASNANVTFQTQSVGKVGEDGKVQPVNRDESWIKVDADGSIVATPPADAEPGEYRVEVVASNGERDTVTVVVAPPPSMKDIYSLRAGEVDPVDVPAGGQRTAAAPRASVFKDGLRDPNRPAPNGSRYEVDYPGATVDTRGRVMYAPPLDAPLGVVRIPVTVRFSDDSVGTFEVAFNVTEPMLADRVTLAYESALAVAPGSSAAVFLTEGSAVPEATTFELREGVRLAGWAASVDTDTGVISVTAPREGGEALTVPVVAYFSDGSSLELDARVEVAGEGRQASVSKLAYDPASGQRGDAVTLPLKGAVPAGTVFKLSDPDLKNTVVDPKTGELTVTVPEHATEAEPLTIRVRASYPDKSVGEIVGRVNVQEQAKLFPPKFGPLTVAVGDSEIIPQFTNVPVGSKFSIPDDARRAGWTVKINEKTGQLEVTTDETVPDGDQFTVPIQITYPDGSVHEVQVPITAKRPAPAPAPTPVPETEDSSSGSSTGDWVAILLGVLAILGAAGYAAWLNQDEIRRVLGQFGINF